MNEGIVYGKKILKGGIILSSATLLINAIGLATSILIARGLGPDDYGTFALIIALSGFLIGISQLGSLHFTQRFVGYYSRKKPLVDSIANFAVRVGALGGVLFLLLTFVGLNFLGFFRDIGRLWLLLILAAGLPFISFNSAVEGSLRGLQKFGRVALQKFFYSFAFLLLISYIFLTGITLEKAIYSVLSAYLIVFVYSVFLYRGNFSFSKQKIEKKKLMSYGLLVTLSGIILFVYTRMNYYLLPLYAPTSEVGFYNIGYFVAEVLLYLAPLTLSAILVPILSDMRGRKLEQLTRASILLAIKYILILQCFFTLAVFVFGRTLVSFLYGAEFLGAVAPMTILVFSTVFYSLFLMLTSMEFSKVDASTIIKVGCCLVILLVVFSIALIPIYHVVGAAISFLATSIISSVFAVRLLKKKHGVVLPLSYFCKPLSLAGLLMLTYWLKPVWMLGILLIPAYALGVILLKMLDRSDFNLIKKVLR